MPLEIIIGDVGAGKTILAVVKAMEYESKNPTNKIYANLHLKGFKNFVYNPLNFFPFDELENSMIICDDLFGKSNGRNYLGLMVNAGRKLNLYVIITVQDDIMVDAVLRRMSYLIYPTYIKELDLLVFEKYKERYDRLTHKVIRFKFETSFIRNVVKLAKNRYDTYEIVAEPLECEYIDAIREMSKTKKDILRNINLYTKNKAERSRIKKLLGLV